MAPSFVTSLFSSFSGSRKSKRNESETATPSAALSLSASVPASFAYTSSCSTLSRKQSEAILLSFPCSQPATPPRPGHQATRSSPPFERERRGSLRRTLSRLSLGPSTSISGSSPKHGRKDSNEIRQPHYLLRRLQQEELEQGYMRSKSVSPQGSPSKAATPRGRAAHAESSMDSCTKYAELAQLISIIENSDSPRSPRPAPFSSTASKMVDLADPFSPSPARKLLKPRRSLPLLSGFIPLADSTPKEDASAAKPRERLRSSIPFSLTYPTSSPIEAEKVVAERTIISYKVRPSISYPILIEPEHRPLSQHACIEHAHMPSWSDCEDEGDECTIRANTTYSTTDTIVPDLSYYDVESLDELLDAFPSPVPSRDVSPTSTISFSSLPQLYSSDDASSSSSSTLTTPATTPELSGLQDGFDFSPIFPIESLLKLSSTSEHTEDVEEQEEQIEKVAPLRLSKNGLTHKLDANLMPTARTLNIPFRQDRIRGVTALSTISSVSGFSLASFAQRLLVEDQPECRAPFYLEDDRLYWPQVLTC